MKEDNTIPIMAILQGLLVIFLVICCMDRDDKIKKLEEKNDKLFRELIECTYPEVDFDEKQFEYLRFKNKP